MWADIPTDVRLELLDPLFLTRTHHKASTYAKGCRGPLCRKAEREKQESNRKEVARITGKNVKTYKQGKGDVHRDELLQKIYHWHLQMRTSPNGYRDLLSSFLSQDPQPEELNV